MERDDYLCATMKRIIYISVIFLALAAVAISLCYNYATREYEEDEIRLNIGAGITGQQLGSLLKDKLGEMAGTAVYNIWKLRGGTPGRAHGSYTIRHGDKAYHIAMRIRGGMQDPVNVTIANVRDRDRAIEQIASNFEFETSDLIEAIDSVAASNGIDKSNIIAIILPDTYQYYWTSSARSVAESLFREWKRFWNDERIGKARRIGLEPTEVSTLASIVEEESAKTDERPRIARLYLNRLSRKMKLQSDPTVKYALGDPSLRRILNVHLVVESPYNTYIHEGLPPGPIRMVDKSTIDGVLDAPKHEYLYMCAKEDFSGYHNFAKTLNEHNANAARYHRALNNRGIKK